MMELDLSQWLAIMIIKESFPLQSNTLDNMLLNIMEISFAITSEDLRLKETGLLRA